MILHPECIFRYHGWFKQIRGPQRCTEIHSRWNNSCYCHHIISLYPFKISTESWHVVTQVDDCVSDLWNCFQVTKLSVWVWLVSGKNPQIVCELKASELLSCFPCPFLCWVLCSFALLLLFFATQWAVAFQAGEIQVYIFLRCSGSLR